MWRLSPPPETVSSNTGRGIWRDKLTNLCGEGIYRSTRSYDQLRNKCSWLDCSSWRDVETFELFWSEPSYHRQTRLLRSLPEGWLREYSRKRLYVCTLAWGNQCKMRETSGISTVFIDVSKRSDAVQTETSRRHSYWHRPRKTTRQVNNNSLFNWCSLQYNCLLILLVNRIIEIITK